MTNRKLWATAALVAVIALIAVACQTPAAAPTGTVHVVVDNADDIGMFDESILESLLDEPETARAVGDTNMTSLVLSGDVTAAGDATFGNLTVTGGVTGTNVLVTGNQTVAGIKTFSTAIAVGAVTGPVTLTGPTAVATATPAAIVNNLGAANVSFEVRDSATPVFQVLNGGNVAAGVVYSKVPPLAKTGNYTVLSTDTGAIIKSSGSITMTLPSAVAGYNFCIVNFDGGDLTIDFADTADVAINEVNSPGDRVTNTTAFDNICLTALDTTNWSTVSSVGTWADGN